MNPNSLSRKGFRPASRQAGPGSLAALFLVALVKLYQRALSPLIRLLWGNVCRFEPSCSNYAVACLETHGALRGSLLSITRLCKCHPFHPGGHDPPPPGRPHDPADTFALIPKGARTSRRAS
jgi:putative membrane protein insertion efficiency factor